MRACLCFLSVVLLVPALGCGIPWGIDDENYPAYGGRWQRHDMAHGRVGSAFSPQAGYQVTSEEPVDAAGD